MEGQLSENPLAELIREISFKHLSGRLRLQQERVTVVVYFKAGELIYAASNARMFRLREYLLKENVLSEAALTGFDPKRSDISLARELIAKQLVNESRAAQLQLRQVTDVLRLALLWTEGQWDFDPRSQLGEDVPFKVDRETLLLETGRRIPSTFAASRFHGTSETISPASNLPQRNDLQPAEVMLLSRLDVPTSTDDLIVLSGLPEEETLRVIYALSLAGFVQRTNWNTAIDTDGKSAPPPVPVVVSEAISTPAQPVETEAESMEKFLSRLDKSSTHYEVLDIDPTASPAAIKKAYYDFARRYHPDRYRKDSDQAQNLRLEAAFARVTQAYDTLRENGLRATYDSKLDAQRRAAEQRPAPAKPPDAQPKSEEPQAGASGTQSSRPSNQPLTDTDRAEQHFIEGFAAKQRGQLNTAIGMLSSAARLVPTDARYRAYYGQALASVPSTRRLAEAELQAAIKIEPENADYRIMLAELYRDLGFAVRARSEIEKILKMSPNHSKARELMRSL